MNTLRYIALGAIFFNLANVQAMQPTNLEAENLMPGANIEVEKAVEQAKNAGYFLGATKLMQTGWDYTKDGAFYAKDAVVANPGKAVAVVGGVAALGIGGKYLYNWYRKPAQEAQPVVVAPVAQAEQSVEVKPGYFRRGFNAVRAYPKTVATSVVALGSAAAIYKYGMPATPEFVKNAMNSEMVKSVVAKVGVPAFVKNSYGKILGSSAVAATGVGLYKVSHSAANKLNDASKGFVESAKQAKPVVTKSVVTKQSNAVEAKSVSQIKYLSAYHAAKLLKANVANLAQCKAILKELNAEVVKTPVIQAFIQENKLA